MKFSVKLIGVLFLSQLILEDVLITAKTLDFFGPIEDYHPKNDSARLSDGLEDVEESTYADTDLKTFVRRYEKLTIRLRNDGDLDEYNDDWDDDRDDDLDDEFLETHGDFRPRRRGSTFHLDALGEHFKVWYVKQAPSVFASDAVVTIIDDDGHRRNLDLEALTRDHIEGHLIGDVDSHVYGELTSGLFNGVIVTADETYFFEAAEKYFRRPRFNAVAYRASDVTMCPQGRSSGSCSLEKEPLTSKSKPASSNGKDEEVELETEEFESTAVRNRGNECQTLIVVDHTFMAGVAKNVDKKAINEVAIHMIASNKIFKMTDFDGDGDPDGIGFKVTSLQLMKKDSGYLLEGDFSDPDAFLQKVAEHELNDYCFGFVFTFRNMRGVLGASYLGVAKRGVDGGICSSRKLYKDLDNKRLNLNAGFASFKYADHDKVVPRGRSICTVAHEFGHLFGSPHDEVNKEVHCNPPKHQDKFLMTTKRAVNAVITARNQLFSSCSCKHIRSFLSLKGHCLK